MRSFPDSFDHLCYGLTLKQHLSFGSQPLTSSIFEQRLSINQRTELFREMTPKDPVGEGAESHSVTCGKNHRGAIEAQAQAWVHHTPRQTEHRSVKKQIEKPSGSQGEVDEADEGERDEA